jgi:hypothetical protein
MLWRLSSNFRRVYINNGLKPHEEIEMNNPGLKAGVIQKMPVWVLTPQLCALCVLVVRTSCRAPGHDGKVQWEIESELPGLKVRVIQEMSAWVLTPQLRALCVLVARCVLRVAHLVIMG